MRYHAQWVPTAVIAFIAGLTDKEINRVVDEEVLPDNLVKRGEERQLAPIAGVFVRFYFGTSNDLTKALRLSVIDTLTNRFLRRDDALDVIALHFASRLDWTVPVSFGQIELSRFVSYMIDRAASLERANKNVTVDPDIMGGLPVFLATRVPIDTVTSSKAAGISDHRLIATFRF